MSATLAQQALLAHLQAMPGRPAMGYPNGATLPPTPRIVSQISATAQRTASLDGLTTGTAEIVVRVEVESGAYETEANTIIEAIVDRFPVGLRIDGVTILDAPIPRPSIPGSAVYSVPVIIRGFFSF